MGESRSFERVIRKILNGVQAGVRAPPRSGKFGRQGADGWLFLELCRRCGAYDLSAMRLINAGFIANADFT